MKRILVLLMSVMCVGIFAQQQSGQSVVFPQSGAKFEGIKQQPKPKKMDMTLPESPLTVNGSTHPEINLGRVFKMNQRYFTVYIDNPSDMPIEYENIVINCNCTTIVNKVPTKGKIKPHHKLTLVVRLNAPELAVEKSFMRMIRFELKGYRQFQINFVGEVSGKIYTTLYDDPEKIARTKIMTGYLEDPDEPWYTRMHIVSELPAEEPLELGRVGQMKNFTADLHKMDDHHWVVELKGKSPMKPCIIEETLTIEVKKPSLPEGQADAISLPIEGIVGMQLLGSSDEILLDMNKEKNAVIEKAIMLSRTNFMDKHMIKASILGKTIPYHFEVKPLTVNEIKVTAPEGIEVIFDEQSENNIMTIFRIQRDKLTEKDVYVSFDAPKSKQLNVRVAKLSEAERAEIKKREEYKKQEEEQLKKDEAEQDAIK